MLDKYIIYHMYLYDNNIEVFKKLSYWNGINIKQVVNCMYCYDMSNYFSPFHKKHFKK